MTYSLGIDVGTTFTAAAIMQAGRVETFQLGTQRAAIPSVVAFRADDSILVGEAAERRAAAEPDRIAREFKRRFGDPTPMMISGVPRSPESITARLLRHVVDAVERQQGAPPDRVVVTHPAAWNDFRLGVLRQALQIARLDGATLAAEPVAAAVHYASSREIESGARLAVYDFGGGTFDVAIAEKTSDGFELVGEPVGIDRLGGIDLDVALLHLVDAGVAGALAALDPFDRELHRVRADSVSAKEGLSEDSDVIVTAPGAAGRVDVRITRAEFEEIAAPVIEQTIGATQRAVEVAGLTPEDLHVVLLVGGSSRIPLVAEMVGRALGCDVAVDAHPKQAIALGAAWMAGQVRAEEPMPVAAASNPDGEVASDGDVVVDGGRSGEGTSSVRRWVWAAAIALVGFGVAVGLLLYAFL